MLFHSLYAHRSGVDVEQMVCTLSEPIDAAAMERAWQAVANRHTALRTSFQWEGRTSPVQQVHGCAAVPFHSVDWRGFDPNQQRDRLDSYLRTDRRRAFDLSRAPLLRIALFRRRDAEYSLVWTFHHGILDGRSFPVLLKEVFAFHEAFRDGRSIDPGRCGPTGNTSTGSSDRMPPRRSTSGGGGSAVFPLRPASRWGPSGAAIWNLSLSSRTPCELEESLSEKVTSALRDLAANNGITLNTIVQGAWALLLSKYSGDRDVVFGVTRATRPPELSEGSEMVGLFINTVPNGALAGEPGRGAHPVAPGGPRRARCLAAAPVHAAGPDPGMERAPARHAALRQHPRVRQLSARFRAARGGRALGQPVVPAAREDQLPAVARGLRRLGAPLEPGLHGERAGDGAAAAQVLRSLRALLEGMALRPHGKLSELPAIAAEDRLRAVSGWNDTRRDYGEGTIHGLFEESVARDPNAVAAELGEDRLTYGELNARANQLAHHLRELGAGPETVVGLSLERSLDAIVAILAIWKSGGAYLPLDPALPEERLRFMLEETGAAFVVTRKSVGSALPMGASRMIFLDGDAAAIRAPAGREPLRRRGGEQPRRRPLHVRLDR